MTEQPRFAATYYLNGFPKSGLHLAACMLRPIAHPLVDRDGFFTHPWAGTFLGNSWTNDWAPFEQTLYKVSRLRDGHYLKAHTGYHDEVERFLFYSGVAHVFIYRDFRDVAVSQAHHVLHEDDTRFAHPAKGLYRQMDSFDDVLAAVITGIGEYPGVMDRWQHYAGWLDCDWTHAVRYEDLHSNRVDAAKGILRYALQRVPTFFSKTANFNEDAVQMVAESMADAGDRTDASPTYRKGAVGDWRGHFTDEHVDLFKKTDTEDWLVELGYEQTRDWHRDTEHVAA